MASKLNKHSLLTVAENIYKCRDDICSEKFVVKNIQGPELYKFSLEIAQDFVDLHRRREYQDDTRLLILVYSLECSETITTDIDDTYNLFSRVQYITVYLLRSYDYYPVANEEYRKRIRFAEAELEGVFRSWRSEDHATNGWEYSNDIYMRVVD